MAASLSAGCLTPAPPATDLAGSSLGPLPDQWTMLEYAQRHADEWIPTFVPPAGMDPVDANAWVRQQADVLGRSPEAWVAYARDAFALRDVAAQPAAPSRDLVAEVVRVNQLVGVQLLPADVAALHAQAAALDLPLRSAFADLVGVVADVYAEQLPLTQDLVERFDAYTDTHEAFLAPPERDAMAERGARIVDAVNQFRAQTRDLLQPHTLHAGGTDPPLFSDPEGLVVLGGLGDGTYTRSGTVPDAVLIVEPGGNDLYLNSAGGADPTGFWNSNVLVGTGNNLVLSVNVDLAGDDEYTYDGAPQVVQGSGGIGGIGILLDAQGNDAYYAKLVRNAATNIGANVQFYFDAGAQGYAFGGYGLLVDGLGDDTYTFDIFSQSGHMQTGFAQGFGALGGLGVHWDAAGTDWWLANGLGMNPGPGRFLGMYNQGVGFWSGVGLMIDTGLGNDFYHTYLTARTTDYYAQGFGAFAGLGVLYEDGGNDDYVAVEEATSSFPGIDPLLNCAYGTGSLAGLGVLIDLLGDDSYYGDTISARTAFTMNEGWGGVGFAGGVHFDGGGDDNRVMEAHGQQGSITMGRGQTEPGLILDNVFLGPGGNFVGLFVDAGGNDNYEPTGLGSNNNVWPTGADLPLP